MNRYKRKALELHARTIRSIGRCERCGSDWQLECAHIVTRSRSATACDLANAFCLCHQCHAWFTDHPAEWTDFVVSRMGRRSYDLLHWRSLQPVKANSQFWLQQIAELEERAW